MIKKYILSTFIIGFLFVSLSAQAQTQTKSTPLDPTPRVMFLAGAVNQHVDEAGNWLTDPDRISGSHVDAKGVFGGLVPAGTPSNLTDVNRLAYCMKFYPKTTSVEKYKVEQSTAWMSRYNRNGPSTNSAQSYKCVQSGISTEKIKVDGGWSAWTNYQTCSNGKQKQTRTCTNPTPANGGKSCIGSSTQSITCPKDGLPNLTATLSEVKPSYVKGTIANFDGVIKNEGTEINKQFTNSFNLYSGTKLIYSQSTLTSKIAASNTAPTSKAVSMPTVAGTYTLELCTDSKKYILESDETDNCPKKTINVVNTDPSIPNLTASFDNTTYVKGVEGNINATVTKTGTTTKGIVFYNRMDISTKSNLVQAWYSDFKSYKLPTNTTNFVGDTMKVSYPWKFKEGYTGVRFCADQGNYSNNNGLNKVNQIKETSELDNCTPWVKFTAVEGTGSSALPNLTVAFDDTKYVKGVKGNINVTISATGAFPANLAFYNRIDISTRSNLTAAWFSKFRSYKLPINTLNLQNGKYKVSYPWKFEEGYTGVRFCTDQGNYNNNDGLNKVNQIKESNELDNCTDWVKFTSDTGASSVLPDLIIDGRISTDNLYSVIKGVEIPFYATVKNKGTSTLVTFKNHFEFKDSWFGSGSNSNPIIINGLASGAKIEMKTFKKFDKAGVYYVRVCTDQAKESDYNEVNDVKESNEKNNCYTEENGDSHDWMYIVVKDEYPDKLGAYTEASLTYAPVEGKNNKPVVNLSAHLPEFSKSFIKGDTISYPGYIYNEVAAVTTDFKTSFIVKDSSGKIISNYTNIAYTPTVPARSKTAVSSYNFKIPSVGTYTAQFCVDTTDIVVERTNDDNCTTKTFEVDATGVSTLPNLTVAFDDTTYVKGVKGYIKASVIKTGTVPQNVTFYNRMDISTKSTLTQAWFSDFKSYKIPGKTNLFTNDKIKISYSWKFEEGYTGVRFCADQGDHNNNDGLNKVNQIKESNELDNCTDWVIFTAATSTSKSTDVGNTTGQAALKSCQAFQFTRNMSYGSNDYVRFVPAEVSKLKELLIFLKAKYPSDRYLKLITLKDTDGSFGKETQQAVDYLQSFDGSEYGMTDSRVRSFDQQTGNTGPLTRAKLNYLWDNVKCVAENQTTSETSTKSTGSGTSSASSDSTGGGTQNSNSSGGKGATVDYSAPDTAQQ